MLRAFEKKMEEKRKEIVVIGFIFTNDIAFDVLGKQVVSHLGLGGRTWWEVFAKEQEAIIWIHHADMAKCVMTVSRGTEKGLTFDTSRMPGCLGIKAHGSIQFGNALIYLQVCLNGYLKMIRPKVTIVEFERCMTFTSEHWGLLHIGQVCDPAACRPMVTI